MASLSPPALDSSPLRAKLYLFLHFLSIGMLYFPIGQSWYFGNMVVYINSYWYARLNATDLASTWVISVYVMTWSAGLIVAGRLGKFYNLRLCTLIGVVLLSTGFFASYFTVSYSQVAFIVTFGGFIGAGVGFVQCEALSRLSLLVPRKTGLALALMNDCLSIGALTFQAITTWYVNPDNVEANVLVLGNIKIFNDVELIDRTPYIFLVLGVVSSAFQIGGFGLTMFLKDKCIDVADAANPTEEFKTNGGKDLQNLEESSLNEDAESVKSEKKIKSFGTVETTKVLKCKNSLEKNHCFSENAPQEKSSNRLDSLLSGSSSRSEKWVPLKRESETADYDQLQMLKSVEFYILWFILFANDTAYIVLLNFYKIFGGLWINDDHFLTNMGSMILCTVMVFRIIWGNVLDMFSIKTNFTITSSLMSFMYLFYYFTPRQSAWLFGVWSSAIGGLCCTVYLGFPVAVLRLFGKSHFAANFGVLNTSIIALNVVAPQVLQALLNQFGWFPIFAGIGVINILALLANLWALPNRP